MQIKDKVLLITGGTGSFGTAVLNRFLHTDHFKEIRIFSRDEKKQDDMRNLYKNPKIKVLSFKINLETGNWGSGDSKTSILITEISKDPFIAANQRCSILWPCQPRIKSTE